MDNSIQIGSLGPGATSINYFESDAELVKQFTEESGSIIPHEPQLMTKDEVSFIIKMMLDEIMELYATVADSKEAKMNMIKMICDSKDIDIDFKYLQEYDPANLIGQQADAFVDSYYYSLNASAKKGINLSSIFQLVHKANMDKRDPATGKFIKREDGKIIKPQGWSEKWDGNGFITREIVRQAKDGAFCDKGEYKGEYKGNFFDGIPNVDSGTLKLDSSKFFDGKKNF